MYNDTCSVIYGVCSNLNLISKVVTGKQLKQQKTMITPQYELLLELEKYIFNTLYI